MLNPLAWLVLATLTSNNTWEKGHNFENWLELYNLTIHDSVRCDFIGQMNLSSVMIDPQWDVVRC